MKDPADRYCTGCIQILSNEQSFLCRRGYWAASSPFTIKMEDGCIVRPKNCIDKQEKGQQ